MKFLTWDLEYSDILWNELSFYKPVLISGLYSIPYIYVCGVSSAFSLGATTVFSRAYYSTSVKNLNKLKAVHVTKYPEWALETLILYV